MGFSLPLDAPSPFPIDFKEFAAQSGVEGLLSEHGALNYPHGISKIESRRIASRTLERLDARSQALRKAQLEYQRLINTGLVRPLTRRESLERTAAGHDDNPAVQAARRVLARLPAHIV